MWLYGPAIRSNSPRGWSTSSSGVAVFRSPAGRPSCSSGTARFRRAGSGFAVVILAACAGDLSGPRAGEPASIEIDSADTALLLGDSLNLRAVVRNHLGDQLAWDDSIVWVTHDKTVALVSRQGLVTTTGLGATWIVASDRQHRDSVRLSSSMRIMSVHALSDATCALNSNGQAVCWGWNEQGLLGNGTFDDSRRPLPAAGDHRFTSLNAAGGTVCGVKGQAAWCWGYNGSGQLADGTWNSRSEPGRLPPSLPIQRLMLGAGATPCAVVDTGSVFCWGWNLFGQLLDSTRVSQRQPIPFVAPFPIGHIASGGGHVCALATDGSAWCWGRGELGQIGNNTNDAISGATPVHGGHRFEQIASGFEHTCALTAAGAVWCWGSNRLGQLGTGIGSASSVPVQVASLPAADTIVSTRDHTCVLASSEAWCWGANLLQQVGGPPSPVALLPVRMDGLQLRSISAGMSHTCGIDLTGIGWCWGSNRHGNLGALSIGGSTGTPRRIAFQP